VRTGALLSGRALDQWKRSKKLKEMPRPKTKILVDGGDPSETQRIKELIGFVDGSIRRLSKCSLRERKCSPGFRCRQKHSEDVSGRRSSRTLSGRQHSDISIIFFVRSHWVLSWRPRLARCWNRGLPKAVGCLTTALFTKPLIHRGKR
jgi:hypothetical protein